MNNKTIIIIGVVLVLLAGTSTVFMMQQEKQEESVPAPDIPQDAEEVVITDECPGVTPQVTTLLKANNIDLSRLNRIDSETNMLGYAAQSTGYTYSVAEHKTEKVFDGMLDRVVLKACYNHRLIITRDLRISFMNGIFHSIFDFEFTVIDANPNPKITLADAKKIAHREQSTLSGVEPKLGYYDIHAGQGQMAPKYILAWEFRRGAHVVIDAHSGKVVRSFNGIMY